MPFGALVAEATYIYGRGKWVNIATDANGNITVGTPSDRRTPWFTQTDFNLGHRIKVGEHQSIGFEASVFNILNQRSVTAFYQGMNSVNFQTPLIPSAASTGLFSSGAALYQTLESGYNPQTWINGVPGSQLVVLGQHAPLRPFHGWLRAHGTASRSSTRTRAACASRCATRSKLNQRGIHRGSRFSGSLFFCAQRTAYSVRHQACPAFQNVPGKSKARPAGETR
jgi:hypothetical protein